MGLRQLPLWDNRVSSEVVKAPAPKPHALFLPEISQSRLSSGNRADIHQRPAEPALELPGNPWELLGFDRCQQAVIFSSSGRQFFEIPLIFLR